MFDLDIKDIFAGMAVLIAIYLIASNADGTVKVLNAIASGTTSTVKTLQARG